MTWREDIARYVMALNGMDEDYLPVLLEVMEKQAERCAWCTQDDVGLTADVIAAGTEEV